MGNLCVCGQGKQNLGLSGCPDLMKIARRLIIVPELDASGAKNELANVAAVTKAALQAKFDETEIDDRFFALDIMENVENLRADTKFQEFDSGSKAKIEDGIKQFTGFLVNRNTVLLEKLQSWGCQKFGVYIIDKSGNFIYFTDSSTKLLVQPLMVQEKSWDAQYISATEGETSMIKITFDFRFTMADKYIRYIPVESLDFDGLGSDLYSLIDVNGAYSGISQTGVTLTLTDDYGLPVKNLLTGDFALYNNTTLAAVIITGFTESADGVYDMVFASQTVADVMKSTITKSRYDFTDVTSLTWAVA